MPTGSELLLLAARRDVGNLCVAHRVWELLRRGGRWVGVGAADVAGMWLSLGACLQLAHLYTSPPSLLYATHQLQLAHRMACPVLSCLPCCCRVPRSPAAFKYMRALCLLEAHKSPQRLREVRCLLACNCCG